ncbi:diguanylate cyclase (GGDEF) domain-containing protein [Pseudoxanthomonas sp. GM95]|uniref:GGDEF domain-containing protein n=1 Tax=Pseudoxanthomonas sp. GM95 TaxID=1881043 RepID=UPI0008AB659D|nr:GGDEF domain-containing protein [Pseudoxanthomonas sp. GM95]SEM13445.1 diguanylate cyclase (GGDEF) domain-containing protein [Pseudoxanthomonas sp. GM95]
MANSVFFSLISDCTLSIVLFFLFLYVGRISRSLHGISTWGAAHLVYTLGAASIDVVTEALRDRGHPVAAMLATNLAGIAAAIGMTGLALAVLQFVQQRHLRKRELIWMPLAILLPVGAWCIAGTQDSQGVALSIVEVLALAVMIWQLRHLNGTPDRVPARLMMAACTLLIGIYSSVVPGWFKGLFGIDDMWVSTDLALWFMLNFCMLTLTSFHAAEALRRSALIDPLTGALNRRGLSHGLDERRAPGAAAIPDGVAVLALDLDRFKAINDAHGHHTGDRVLQAFSDTVRRCIRQDDLFARTGGEEFVVVSVGLDCDEAAQLAERIRVATEQMQLPQHQGLHVGVSVGVACTARQMAVHELMDLADRALYAAKHGGRNRVELHEAA